MLRVAMVTWNREGWSISRGPGVPMGGRAPLRVLYVGEDVWPRLICLICSSIALFSSYKRTPIMIVALLHMLLRSFINFCQYINKNGILLSNRIKQLHNIKTFCKKRQTSIHDMYRKVHIQIQMATKTHM